MPGSNTAAETSAGETPAGPQTLGVMIQGRLNSFFSDRPQPERNDEAAAQAADSFTGSLLQRSPESARIVLYSSNDFMDDQVLNGQVMASGTQYLGPIELLLNTLDWALQDDELLRIRSRAHFNRTLPPMERQAQAIIEYLNYGMALLWLGSLAFIHWLRKLLRRRRYAARLGL